MEYEQLNKEEFDAIVSGELNHYALWLESEVEDIILDYFGLTGLRGMQFEHVFFRRDCLFFQAKIDICRAMLSWLDSGAGDFGLKSCLHKIESFKSERNAMAHGHEVDGDDSPRIAVEIVNRGGKPKFVEITPDSHRKATEQAELLLAEIRSIRKSLKRSRKRR